MRLFTFLFSLLPLIACITAALVQPLLARSVPAVSVASFGQGLDKRQVNVPSEPTVPTQCTPSCNPVNDEIKLGCPVTMCCTTTFQQQYYDCLECVGMALNGGNYSIAQNDLNLLYMTCVDVGYILSPMALPGQSVSGSSSSAKLQATSSGPAVSSASATASSTKSSNTVVPSSSGTHATGAAISSKWGGLQIQALIGAAVLLGGAGLW